MNICKMYEIIALLGHYYSDLIEKPLLKIFNAFDRFLLLLHTCEVLLTRSDVFHPSALSLFLPFPEICRTYSYYFYQQTKMNIHEK